MLSLAYVTLPPPRPSISLSRSEPSLRSSHRGCCRSRCDTHARCGHVGADSPPAELSAGKGCDKGRRGGCEDGQERESRETSHDEVRWAAVQVVASGSLNTECRRRKKSGGVDKIANRNSIYLYIRIQTRIVSSVPPESKMRPLCLRVVATYSSST